MRRPIFFENVTSIGDSAFNTCSQMTNIYIGNKVTSLGNSALANCSNLAAINIPNSLTNIGAGALANCSSLAAINVDALNPVYSSFGGVLFDRLQTTVLIVPRGKVGNFLIPDGVTGILQEASALAACPM